MHDGSTMENAELHKKLVALQEEHRDLDSAIQAMGESPTTDRLLLQRMKKRKLSLRDQIRQIEDQMLPDIIA